MVGQRPQVIEKYHAIRSNSAILGIPLPILFGTNRLTAKLIWYGDFVANKAKVQGGKGLGKSGAQYVYTASVMAALCMGPAYALLSVWDSTDKFVVQSYSDVYVVGSSSQTFTPTYASAFAADQGPSMVAAYSYVVNDYGSPGPVTLSGNTNVPMTKVSGTPASGQYSVNPTTGVYTFSSADAGAAINVNYAFYRYVLEAEQLAIVPFSGPYTVTVNNSGTFKADMGVVYDPSGNALTRSSGSPAVGQYSESGGTYTFNSADAGQGIVINYSYTDPNTDTNAPNTLNLTLIYGTQGQSPWPYLSTKHPSQALGYTQVALVASSGLYLGYTPELPNYTYEVMGSNFGGGGTLDASLYPCIVALLTDQGYGIGFPLANLDLTSLAQAQKCWTANSFFVSPLLENQETAASVIGQWLEAGMVGAFWSEGKLKFAPYCDTSAVGNGVLYQPSTTPVWSFTDGDYIPESAKDDPIQIARSPYMDAFNRVQINYANRINDYNLEPIVEEDAGSIQTYGLRAEDPKSYDFITTLVAAQYAASMRLQRNVYVRNTYRFTVASSNAFLEPMDVIQIKDTTLGLNAIPVRITEIEDDTEKGITITAEDFIWGTAVPAYNPKDLNNPPAPLPSQQDPGSVNTPIIIEANNRVTQQQGYQLWFGVSGSGANYGGCHVWISLDGTTYKQITDINGNDEITGNARMGVLTAPLPNHADPDTTDILAVDLTESGGVLLSGAAADANDDLTLCLVDNELISYQTAALTAPSKYNLSALLRRGQLTSTIASHSVGAPFLRIDSGVFKYSFDPTLIGKTVYFKFTAFNTFRNMEQTLSEATAYSVTIAGTFSGAILLDAGMLSSTFVNNPVDAFAVPASGMTLSQTGVTMTIVMASGTVQFGSGTVSYNSASVSPSYGTWYIYFDDPRYAGGNVTLNATTNAAMIAAAPGRVYVGKITTTNTGGGSGGGTGGGSGGGKGGGFY